MIKNNSAGQIITLMIDGYLHEKEFSKLLDYVDQEKRIRIKKYRHIEDSQRSLFSDLLARYMLAEALDIHMDKIIFTYNEFKKPQLKDADSLHFNVSHSGQVIMAATAPFEVGIDVEMVNKIDLNIAKHYFTGTECEYILSGNDKVLERFYEIWTRKESFLKALGTGLYTPLNCFDVCKDNIEYNSKQYYIQKLEPLNEYARAVCTSNSHELDWEFRQIKLSEFVNMLYKKFNIT